MSKGTKVNKPITRFLSKGGYIILWMFPDTQLWKW